MDPIGMGKRIVEGAKSLDGELDKRSHRQLKSIIYAILAVLILGAGGYYCWSQIMVPWIDRNTIQPGTIEAFAGDKIPDGWLLCDGRWFTFASIQDGNKSKSLDLARLYAVVGEKFGNGGDGQGGQASLPDLRGMFLRGADGANRTDSYALRPADNTLVGKPQMDGVGSHAHSMKNFARIKYDASGSTLVVNIPHGSEHKSQVSQEGEKDYVQGAVAPNEEPGVETRPKNVAVNYIIKY